MRCKIIPHILPLLLLAGALSLNGCANRGRYYRMEGFAQGGTWHVICELPSGNPKTIKRVQQGIDSVLLEIDGSISGYNRGSLLSRFNSGERVRADAHFRTLFELSKELCERTEGRFDPSAGPLFDLWGFGFSPNATAPSQAAIDSVMRLVGMQHFAIAEDGTVTRDDLRCRLNFNAIAQGYSCDVIAAFLTGQGCSNFLVEVGGEIVCRGTKARGELWNIVCDAPQAANDTLHLTDCAIVTSGNYRKNASSGGKSYGHIIDPRTGKATSDISASGTIIVNYEETQWPGATADALATAAVVK